MNYELELMSKAACPKASALVAGIFGYEDAISFAKYLGIPCRKIALLARKSLATIRGLFLTWVLEL